MKKLTLLTVISVLIFALASPPAAAQFALEVAARAYALSDFQSGDVIVSENGDEQMVPASLVKIMTLKLAFEAVERGVARLDDPVPISQKAWKTGGSKMFILVNTTVPLHELLAGIAIVSGNDACVAVAEYLAGTEEAFVQLMNDRAKELGLTHTRFVDSHGLSDQNVTTANDIIRLARAYVADHPEALQLHSQRTFTYGAPGESPITQQNRNRLLGTYEGADGLKTGFTEAAGYNLLGTAERDGQRFIAVVLGVSARTMEEGEIKRAEEVAKLLNFGFRNFVTRTVATPEQVSRQVRVYRGTSDWVQAGITSDVIATLRRGEEDAVRLVTTINEPLLAPVKKGDPVGTLNIVAGTREIKSLDIVALEDVPQAGLFKRFLDSIRLFFARLTRRA